MLHPVLKTLAFAFFVLLTSACERMTQHDYAQLETTFKDIHKFTVFDDINAEFIADTVNKIILTAPLELINQIGIDTLDHALLFSNNNKNNWQYYGDSIRVTVHYQPPLQELRLHGNGNINFVQPTQTSRFDLLIFGGSGIVRGQLDATYMRIFSYAFTTTDLIFSGFCQTLFADFDGTGRINALDLKVDEASLIHNSTNDHYLHVEKQLDVRFFNIGNLYVAGNPLITVVDSVALDRIIPITP